MIASDASVASVASPASQRSLNGDVDFRERADERDSIEGITGPCHREPAGKFCDQLYITVDLDAFVEVDNGFSKPYADDPERGDTYQGSYEPKTYRDGYFRDIPSTKPAKPLQVHIRWASGLSSFLVNWGPKTLSPHLIQNANRAKKPKKSHNSDRPTTMRYGVATTESNIEAAALGSTSPRSSLGGYQDIFL